MLLTEILSTIFFAVSEEVKELGATEESLVKRIRLTETRLNYKIFLLRQEDHSNDLRF